MHKKNISIIIAEDHPIMRNGLVQELELAGYTVEAALENGAAAVDSIATLQPEIAILDIEMPLLNGFEVIKHCKTIEKLKTRFIIMTYHRQKSFVVQAKKVGVDGYLLKEDSIEEIENCIHAVMNGEEYFSNSFASNFDKVVDNELKKVAQLTPSERTIIRLISQGKNSTEVGEILKVSPRTVQKHRTNIILKLELEPAADTLLKWAKEHKELLLSL